MKKLFYSVVFAAILMMTAALSASAAACTCGCGKPHDSSHTQDYTLANKMGYTTPTQHQGVCRTCISNGHSESCEQVRWNWQNHQFIFEGEGTSRRKVCTVCRYTQAAPCTHSSTVWEDMDDKCVQKCKSCGLILQTLKHDYKAVSYKNSSGVSVVTIETSHALKCTRCGYSSIIDQNHHFNTVYKAYKAAKSPFADIANQKCAILYHSVTRICKDCGYSYTVNGFSDPQIRHTFKNNRCVCCGFSRTILPKAKSIRVSGKGKLINTTQKVPAHWEWVGNSLYWRKARSYQTSSFKVKISWRKVSSAYGYVISTDKLKAGDYVSRVGKGYSASVTRKTKYSYYANLIDQSVKKVTIYVAPLSKNGFIGKVNRITVKVR